MDTQYSNNTVLRLSDHIQTGKHFIDLFTNDAAMEWIAGYDSEHPLRFSRP